jgi:F0F1-type ATP synthase membrane subunit b/b'
MKKTKLIIYSIAFLIFAMFLIQSCDPPKKEISPEKQKVIDSLAENLEMKNKKLKEIELNIKEMKQVHELMKSTGLSEKEAKKLHEKRKAEQKDLDKKNHEEAKKLMHDTKNEMERINRIK